MRRRRKISGTDFRATTSVRKGQKLSKLLTKSEGDIDIGNCDTSMSRGITNGTRCKFYSDEWK